MLPFKKADSPFKSNPVSRVGSSTRLNQLGNIKSNPTTPNAALYVTSSLNPLKNLPTNAANVKLRLQTQKDLDAFAQLPMVQKVNEYERLLNELSEAVSQFKNDELQEKIGQIITCNDVLKQQIEDLNKHRNYSYEVDKLSDRNKILEENSKFILKELVSYRNELKKLPKLPKSDKMVNRNVDVDDILKYAFKLAKFTKAPATVANMPFQIHPNNYVWPAEDSLRRGMLAQASLQAEEIIRHELGETDKENSNEVKTESKVDHDDDDDDEMEDVRISNENTNDEQRSKPPAASEHDTSKRKEEQNQQPVDLNLDLFDPDDEYSD